MIRVTGVTVYPLYVRLKVGEWYYDASATVCPANADCDGVTWHSSDTSVASVHPTTGVIHGVSEGTATIYATSTDGSNVSDSLSVVVDERIDVCSVTLGRCAASVEVGGNTWLCATVLPANADNLDLCWSSSDTSVATVDGNGYVTGVSAGFAIITATAHNGASDSCIVEVTQDILVESVCLNYECLSLNIGQVEGLIATVCPCDANNKQVVWSSSNPDIVTVTTSGMIMAQSCGVATIIAAATDGSSEYGICTVTVNSPIPVASVEVCSNFKIMKVGETECLCATVCPNNATNQNVIWFSNDECVATVGNCSGIVTANKAGIATITAVSLDGGHMDYCTISVVGPAEFVNQIDCDLISFEDIKHTDDDFHIIKKPLGEILIDAGVLELIDSGGESAPSMGYYDDWYIYAVPSNTGYSYGLIKMREQEDDCDDVNNPCVTISFIKFDIDILNDCLNDDNPENRKKLYEEIDRVVFKSGQDYDNSMKSYFSDPSKKASYMIAEMYVSKVASNATNGRICAPDAYLGILDKISQIEQTLKDSQINDSARALYQNMKEELMRIPNAIEENNAKAGYNVYDLETNTILINDIDNLTIYEKYAILMTHTSNVTFNSFAAEVLYHADMLNVVSPNFNILGSYESAIRADMGIGEEYESGVTDAYYDLNGILVAEQIEHHGEY